MLTNEKLNNGEVQKKQKEQVKISPQPTQPVSSQSAPPEEAGFSGRPVVEEVIEPEQKFKKEKRRKKVDVSKNKIVKIEDKNVLMVPSGFEIMTKDGWKPVMMRADKIIRR